MTLAETQALATDIAILARHTGMTFAEAGAHIETEMDGTQPANLVAEAVALATQRSVASHL